MSSADFNGVEPWPIPDKQPNLIDTGTPISSVGSTSEAPRKPRDLHGMDRVVTCLLAEDNPISIKILEVSVRLHLRVFIPANHLYSKYK